MIFFTEQSKNSLSEVSLKMALFCEFFLWVQTTMVAVKTETRTTEFELVANLSPFQFSSQLYEIT